MTVDKKVSKLVDVVTGEQITGQPAGERTIFNLTLEPGSYKVLSPE